MAAMNNESLEEYKRRLLKLKETKVHIITNSWGSKYIYRSFPKDHIIKSVSECTFLKIIRLTNNILAEELSKGVLIELPYIGELLVGEINKCSYIEDGKVINPRPIDWKSTYELWYEDKDAEKNKFLIRFKDKKFYKVYWKRSKFENQTFFRFTPCRNLKRKLKDNINKGDIFAYRIKKDYHKYGE